MSLAKNLPTKFLPLGAIIQEVTIGGRNVVLGFPKQQHYRTVRHPYFGETIGRLPNRLSDGIIHDLNGRNYNFAKNERGVTTLHGGVRGWGKKTWAGPETVFRKGKKVAQFTLRSPDGDEGFPGEIEARVWYDVEHKNGEEPGRQGSEKLVLGIEYEARMVGNEVDITETVCSMTNHGYWNITGGPTIAGTEITFATDDILEVDENQIPIGRTSKCPSIEKDKPVVFTQEGPRIDDCFVIDTDVAAFPSDTRDRPFRKCVSMYHPEAKIHLELETTEPCLFSSTLETESTCRPIQMKAFLREDPAAALLWSRTVMSTQPTGLNGDPWFS